ncbi:MAG: hypothetical protein COA78_04875 [Blastopirellula sp.]|nr:MAG: hypothetical protein COA78_04875 [Blastopirellula sp.]
MKTKSTKRNRLYYYLIGFSLLIVLLTMIPLHSYSRSYTQAVRDNDAWAERVNLISQLGELVAIMHKSSIPTLNSDHVSINKDQLVSSNLKFQEIIESVRADFVQNKEQSELGKRTLTLRGIEEHGSIVYQGALELIQQLESELPMMDASRRNQLDQSMHKSLSLIHKLHQDLQDRQSLVIESQKFQAKMLEWILLAITAALSLVVSGTLWYGHQHVAAKMREEKRNEDRLEVILTTKDTVNSHITQIHDLSNEVIAELDNPNQISVIKQIHQQANSLSDIVQYMIKKVRPDQPEPIQQISKSNTVKATTACGDAPEEQASQTRLNCRVLTADDGPNNQRFNCFVLKKAGADVVGADNGQIALDLALKAQEEGKPFDIFLMDMQMPVLDGFEATRKLRAAGFTEPIIALTGSDEVGDKEKCLAAGCDEFITKPVSREKLVQVVAHHAAQLSKV